MCILRKTGTQNSGAGNTATIHNIHRGMCKNGDKHFEFAVRRPFDGTHMQKLLPHGLSGKKWSGIDYSFVWATSARYSKSMLARQRRIMPKAST